MCISSFLQDLLVVLGPTSSGTLAARAAVKCAVYVILTAEEGHIFVITAMKRSRGVLSFKKFPVSNGYRIMLGFITVHLNGHSRNGCAAVETIRKTNERFRPILADFGHHEMGKLILDIATQS